MRKIAIGFGVFFALLLALIIIVPLVVDVDKYRPQIENAANQKINGTLKLGKLSLSLWGQVKVVVQGVQLTDAKGTEVVSVKDAFFHLPLMSLITGSPVLTFKMDQPMIHVIKDKAGKLNVMTLMKESTEKAGTLPDKEAAPSPVDSQDASKSGQEIPGIVSRARLGVDLKDALLKYEDQKTGLSTQVKDLNLILKNMSLSRPTELELWANLDTKLGKTFLMRGPAKLTGKALPQLKDNKLEFFKIDAHLDMNEVQMSSPGMFEKRSGIPTQMDLVMVASEQNAKVENVTATFFNAVITGSGDVNDLKLDPKVHFKLASNEVPLGPWVELVPMLKEYALTGVAQFNASVDGTAEKLNYQSKVSVKDMTAKAPRLKEQPKINAVVNISTDKIDSFTLSMAAPGNDLKAQGKMVSFTHPKIDAQITSEGMDLDRLIEFPAKGTPQGGVPTGSLPNSPIPPTPGEKADYDAMLNSLRENPVAVNTVANLSVNMKSLKAYQVQLSAIACKTTLKDLTFTSDGCGFKVFGGSIKSTAAIQMKPKVPLYRFGVQVAGLDMSEAIKSQMEVFKNTLTGKADFDMSGNGASFNSEKAIPNLNLKGGMKVGNATFATIDIMKMVNEALTKTLDQLGEKIPAVKGKSINLPNRNSEYESISSNFTLNGGKFSAPNFQTKAKPSAGIDVKGNTSVDLKTQALDASWEVIDTYNLTKARELSVEQAGVKVEHLLTEGGAPLKFPIHVGCTLKAPCYSYTEVPAYLVKIALSNASKAVTGRAKQEVNKQADKLLDKVAPGVPSNVKDKLKGLFR